MINVQLLKVFLREQAGEPGCPHPEGLPATVIVHLREFVLWLDDRLISVVFDQADSRSIARPGFYLEPRGSHETDPFRSQ